MPDARLRSEGVVGWRKWGELERDRPLSAHRKRACAECQRSAGARAARRNE